MCRRLGWRSWCSALVGCAMGPCHGAVPWGRGKGNKAALAPLWLPMTMALSK